MQTSMSLTFEKPFKKIFFFFLFLNKSNFVLTLCIPHHYESGLPETPRHFTKYTQIFIVRHLFKKKVSFKYTFSKMISGNKANFIFSLLLVQSIFYQER